MGKKVVGVDFKGLVIIGHGAPQVVDVVACQGTVDVIIDGGGLQVDGLGELGIGVFPFFSRKADHGPHGPQVAVVGVDFQALVEKLCPLHGVFLQQEHFSFERIRLGKVFPSCHHRVEVFVGMVVVFLLYAAEHAVVPQILVVGQETYGFVIIVDGLLEVSLPDVAQGSQFKDVGDVGVQVDGL